MKERRKKILINSHLQFKFIFICILLIVSIFIISFLSSYFFIYKFQQLGLEVGLSKDHVFFTFLKNQEFELLKIYLISTVLSCFIIFIFGLYLSHKFIGPMEKIIASMDWIAKNNQAQYVKIRKNDFLHPFVNSFNSMVKKIYEKH